MLVLRKFHINLSCCVSKKCRLLSSSSNISSENDKASKTDDKKNSQKLQTESSTELPPEPENCCMSGCENCVWKQYATELTELYKDSGEKARKIILEKIKDPSMQIFLKMELEFMDKKKQ